MIRSKLGILFFGGLGLLTMIAIAIAALLVRAATCNRFCISGRVRR